MKGSQRKEKLKYMLAFSNGKSLKVLGISNSLSAFNKTHSAPLSIAFRMK